MGIETLASYRRCVDRITQAWEGFLGRRDAMLAQQRRYGEAAEKVAENILADLFAEVLDWQRGNINYQVGYADMVLTDLGIPRLIVELKRPDALSWNRRAVELAVAQARRYADAQGVKCIAVSDGRMLYATQMVDGGLRDRVFVALDRRDPPTDLWWLSRHGIYRPRTEDGAAMPELLPQHGDGGGPSGAGDVGMSLLHPTYKLPAECFAYVGRADDPRSWKLPYRLADLSIDRKRLPKAIQAILTNYRGARVGGIPEEAIPAVLARLAEAARGLGLMPPEAPHPAAAYAQLAVALETVERRG